MPDARPVAIYDSGLGGLSVLRAVRDRLPDESILYFADQANVPYGEKDLPTLRRTAEAVMRYLIAREAKLIVFACNTISAAALHEMRDAFPGMPIVGMEPAVKPAAEETQTRRVAVIATEATFQGKLFASVVERFAAGVTVFERPCPGLVEMIEAGDTDSPVLLSRLHAWLDPLVAEDIDRLVLGCTHYPLARDAIRQVVGPKVTIIDPAPAIARQIERVLTTRDACAPGPADFTVRTTATPDSLAAGLRKHLNDNSATVRLARWKGEAVVDAD